MDNKSSNFYQRLHRALGPALGGLALDVVDLTTFGPLGLYLGLLVGASIGWWLACLYQLGNRWLWAIAAGVYCALPFTEFFPLAALLGAAARFAQPSPGDEKPQ